MRSLVIAAFLLLLAGSAGAATVATFTPAEFAASQQQNKPILVFIEASWCPVCAKQRPILSELEKLPEFKDLVVYQVDFDAQKDVVRAMGAQKQSTLVVFHGGAEKGRSTGETDQGAIKSLLEKSNS